MNSALGPGRTFTKVGGNRMFRDQLLDLNQAEFLYFPPGGATVGTQLSDAGHEWSREAGPIWDPAYGVPFSEFGHAAGEVQHFQDVAGDVEYELGMLQSGFSYVREEAGEFTAATDGLTLSTETAEQALLAAGLTSTSVTQILDIMRQAGLDPTTIAWGELEAAVYAWGDATDTEVDRVIDNLGKLRDAQAAAQGAAGSTLPGSGSSGGGGGADDRTQRGLDQLMALAYRVAEERARMGGKPQDFVDHELGKVLGQLGAPGSVADKLALLRLFFAGGAHGISFGLGPSASDLGVNIPQFAGGGTVPGPLGAPQLIVAHGGEHIVPHRATGSPTIIRIELDREVLAQAVLGDLLRLQGREVTLGLS